MGFLCCFRPSVGLAAQRGGSEEGPNLGEVAVPEPARNITASNLTAIPQATQATSTKPHFEVATLLVELLHALACPDYDNIQAPVDITQRVASVVRSRIGAAAVRLYGWAEDVGPPEDWAAALASVDAAVGPREGCLVQLAESTTCSINSSAWELHGGAADGPAPCGPGSGRGWGAGEGPEPPLRLRVGPSGALEGDGVALGSGCVGLMAQALTEKEPVVFFSSGHADEELPPDCVRDAARLGSTAFAALPLGAGRGGQRPVGLLWVALAPSQLGGVPAQSLIPCCSLLQTLPSGRSVEQQEQNRSQLVTVGLGVGGPSVSAGHAYHPGPDVAEELLRDRAALQQLAGAVSLALAASAPAGSPGPPSSASDRAHQDDPLSWRAGVVAQLWAAGSLQALLEAVRQATAQHVARGCLAEVVVTAAVVPGAAAKLGYMLAATGVPAAAVAPPSGPLPLPLSEVADGGRESPPPSGYTSPFTRPATLGELPSLPFPIGDPSCLESPSGWGVRRPVPGISVSPPPPRPPTNHRPPKRSASLQAPPAAPGNGNTSLSFTLIAAAGIPYEPSAHASSRFHPGMQHVRRLSPPAATHHQAPQPQHHHATADGHVHPNPSGSLSVRGTHDGRTSLSSSQLPRLVAAAAAAAAGGSGSPAFASPAFAGSIVRPASPDLFAPVALPSLTAKPFQLSKTLLQRMVQQHHHQQGQGAQQHRHRPMGQQSAFPQDHSGLLSTGGGTGQSWVLVGDVVPDCGRWVQDPRLPTRDVVMLMAPPHHTTQAHAHVSQARGTAGTPITSLSQPFSGTARTLSAAGQPSYASPFSRHRASASGLGDAYGSGALAIPSSPKLSDCGMASAGAGPASVGCGARSLVLLGLDVGGGAVLALYLTCSMRLAPRVLGAVRDSCSALLRSLLAPVVRHKLASPDQLGPEWDTLRAGVPGSYAVQQPASPSPIATPALPKAPGSGSGILQQANWPSFKLQSSGRSLPALPELTAAIGAAASMAALPTPALQRAPSMPGGVAAAASADPHGAHPAVRPVALYRAYDVLPPAGMEGIPRTAESVRHQRRSSTGVSGVPAQAQGHSQTSQRSGGDSCFTEDAAALLAATESVAEGPGHSPFAGAVAPSSAAASAAATSTTIVSSLGSSATTGTSVSFSMPLAHVLQPAASSSPVQVVTTGLLHVQQLDGSCSLNTHMGLLVNSMMASLRAAAAAAAAEQQAALQHQALAVAGEGGETSAFGDTDLSDLQLLEVLGSGASGVVLSGLLATAPVAVKLVELPEAPPAAEVGAAEAAAATAAAGARSTASRRGTESGYMAPAAAAAAAEGGVSRRQSGAGTAAAAGAQRLLAKLQATHEELLRSAMELAVLRTLTHVNILQVYAVYDNVYLRKEEDERGDPAFTLTHLRPPPAAANSDPLYQRPFTAIVSEMCDCGSLCDALVKRSFPRKLPSSPPASAPSSASPSASPAAPGAPDGSRPAAEPRALDYIGVYYTLLELAMALRHMHARRLVHRDVKPANLLLKASPGDPRGWTCKLADFGLTLVLDCPERDSPGGVASGPLLSGTSDGSAALTSPSSNNAGATAAALAAMRSQGQGAAVVSGGGGGTRWYAVQDKACGTVTHMAPEAMVKGARIDASVDVFAFGVVMWEIACGRGYRPYKELKPDKIPRAVMGGLRPKWTGDVPQAYRSLAEACWSHEPHRRPTSGQLVAAVKEQLAALVRGGGGGGGGGGKRSDGRVSAAGAT